jgi:hypothetical protein
VAALDAALDGLEGTPVAVPKKGDNRFKDEQWEEHFLFDFIKQSYLITARHIHDVVTNVEGLPIDISKKKVNFFTRQYIDALSPSNFAATNPEVLRETVKTHGQNLLKGFNNLLRDIEEGDGQLRVKMTDPSAFELGRNVAVTAKGKVVFQNEMIQLLQFNPSTKEQYKPAAADHPALDQQVLHPRPAREQLLHQVVHRPGPHGVRHLLGQSRCEAGRENLRRLRRRRLAGGHRCRVPADRREGTEPDRLLPRRHPARLHHGLHGGQEGQARRFGDLLRRPARLLSSRRTRRLHRRGPDCKPGKENGATRLPRRLGDGPAPSTCCAPTT